MASVHLILTIFAKVLLVCWLLQMSGQGMLCRYFEAQRYTSCLGIARWTFCVSGVAKVSQLILMLWKRVHDYSYTHTSLETWPWTRTSLWGTHVAFMFLEKYSREGVLCLENAVPQIYLKAVLKTLSKGHSHLKSSCRCHPNRQVVHILVTLMFIQLECRIRPKSEMFIGH